MYVEDPSSERASGDRPGVQLLARHDAEGSSDMSSEH